MQVFSIVRPALRARIFVACGLVLASALCCTAFAQDNQGAVKAAMLAKYHTTQATADHSDIVTAGDVITFQKSGMVMFPVTTIMHTLSYKDGKFMMGGFSGFAMVSGNAANGNQPRHFVSGEKVWLMDVEVRNDGLYLQFISDPMPDTRYMGTLKFAVDKKQSWPSAAEMMARVGEVISASSGSAPDNQASAPPPPPPSAPTQSISLGQTISQVVSEMGPPAQIIDLGTKKTYMYPGLKVIFINGKVSDVQ